MEAMAMANEPDRKKVIEIFERIKVQLGEALMKLGEMIKNVASKLLGEKAESPTPPEVASPLAKTPIGKPTVSPATIADAIVRHIEVNVDDLTRTTTRSPEFRNDLEKLIKSL